MNEMFTIGDLSFVGYCDTCEHAPIAELSDANEDYGDEGLYQPCDACGMVEGPAMWRKGADSIPHVFQLNRFREEGLTR